MFISTSDNRFSFDWTWSFGLQNKTLNSVGIWTICPGSEHVWMFPQLPVLAPGHAHAVAGWWWNDHHSRNHFLPQCEEFLGSVTTKPNVASCIRTVPLGDRTSRCAAWALSSICGNMSHLHSCYSIETLLCSDWTAADIEIRLGMEDEDAGNPLSWWPYYYQISAVYHYNWLVFNFSCAVTFTYS